MFVCDLPSQSASTVKRNQVGSALMALLGRAPDGKPVNVTAEALVFSGLENVQRRCLRQREPNYEDLHFQLDDDPLMFLERPLLPCEDSGLVRSC